MMLHMTIPELREVVFARTGHSIWLQCPGKKSQWRRQQPKHHTTWVLQADGIDVFGIVDELLMGRPATSLDGQHLLNFETSAKADNMEKFLLEWGARRAIDQEGDSLCPECFGTGLKGGFQAACSRGCSS